MKPRKYLKKRFKPALNKNNEKLRLSRLQEKSAKESLIDEDIALSAFYSKTEKEIASNSIKHTRTKEKEKSFKTRDISPWTQFRPRSSTINRKRRPKIANRGKSPLKIKQRKPRKTVLVTRYEFSEPLKVGSRRASSSVVRPKKMEADGIIAGYRTGRFDNNSHSNVKFHQDKNFEVTGKFKLDLDELFGVKTLKNFRCSDFLKKPKYLQRRNNFLNWSTKKKKTRVTLINAKSSRKNNSNVFFISNKELNEILKKKGNENFKQKKEKKQKKPLFLSPNSNNQVMNSERMDRNKMFKKLDVEIKKACNYLERSNNLINKKMKKISRLNLKNKNFRSSKVKPGLKNTKYSKDYERDKEYWMKQKRNRGKKNKEFYFNYDMQQFVPINF